MKKLVFLLAFTLLPLLTTHAQVTGKSSDPNLEVVIKRVTDMGNGTFRINFLVTNLAKDDITRAKISPKDYYGTSGRVSRVYDDEGNVYDSMKWHFEYDGKRYELNQMDYVSLPSKVPVKFLIDIDNVDEFATAFLRIDLMIEISDFGKARYIQFNNVPLPRKE